MKTIKIKNKIGAEKEKQRKGQMKINRERVIKEKKKRGSKMRRSNATTTKV